MKKELNLKKRLFFTVGVVFVSILLANIPVPGVDSGYLSGYFQTYSALGYINTLSGGAMARLSISGFGISSYISASIILQLLYFIFPSLGKESGYHGRNRIKKMTIALSMAITLVGALTLSYTFGREGLYFHYDIIHVIISCASWLAGTGLIIWMALKIEDLGVGNGISIILAVNILMGLPQQIRNQATEHPVALGILCAVVCLSYIAAIYLQRGRIDVPIRIGRKERSVYNEDAVLPIPVNIVNVLPAVYASAIITLPTMIIAVSGIRVSGVGSAILHALTAENWYDPTHWYDLMGLVLYVILLAALGTFCSHMMFLPEEIADNMRRQGDVIQSVAPGDATVRYLKKRQKALTVINVVFLGGFTVLADLICMRIGLSQITFLGTSLIIIVSTLCDVQFSIQAAAVHQRKRYHLFYLRERSKQKAHKAGKGAVVCEEKAETVNVQA